jgi:hypothetical protein
MRLNFYVICLCLTLSSAVGSARDLKPPVDGVRSQRLNKTLPLSTVLEKETAALQIRRLSTKKVAAGGKFTIQGTGFLGVSSVSIGNVAIANFTIHSNTSIRAMLPPNAVSGLVSVATPTETATGPLPLLVGPSISSFTPDHAFSQSKIMVSGYNLSTATSAAIGSKKTAVRIISDHQIELTVPIDTLTGRIAVHGLGFVSKTANFLQLPMPVKAEYNLLKSLIGNLKSSLRLVQRGRFPSSIRSLSRISARIERYLSHQTRLTADADVDVLSAIEVLGSALLSADDKIRQAGGFISDALNNVSALFQDFGTKTFSDPGHYSFIVPPNVTSLYVAVSGGSGGDGADCYFSDADYWSYGSYGGSGDQTSDNFTVRSGEEITINVGAGYWGDCLYGDGGWGGSAETYGGTGSDSFSISTWGGSGGHGGGCGCGGDGSDGQVVIYW